jgi:hypothetical protein
MQVKRKLTQGVVEVCMENRRGSVVQNDCGRLRNKEGWLDPSSRRGTCPCVHDKISKEKYTVDIISSISLFSNLYKSIQVIRLKDYMDPRNSLLKAGSLEFYLLHSGF